MYSMTAVLLLLAVALRSQAQEQVCLSNDKCYFSGVANFPHGQSNPNRYFAIGGLFDIHEKGTDAYSCGSGISEMGLMNLLAFFWATNYYRNTILLNKPVSVGAVAFDNCMRPEQTMENLLGFSLCKLKVEGIDRQNMMAYVGPYNNMDAAKTGMLANDLKVTMISPTANSFDLNDVHQSTLLRLTPSFDYDLKATLQFLKAVKSDYAIIVFADGPFWKASHESLKNMMKMKGFCAVANAMIPMNADNAQMDTLVNDLLKDNVDAKYIIPLMSTEQVKKLMEATSRNAVVAQRFRFILNSHTGRDKSVTTDNTVVIEPAMLTAIRNEYNLFIDALGAVTKNNTVGISDLNIAWLDTFLNSGKTLKLDESTPSRIGQSVAKTITSVKMIIKGLDKAMTDCAKDSSQNYQLCDKLRSESSRFDIIFEAIRTAGVREKLFEGADSSRQRDPEFVTYNYYVYRNSDNSFMKVGQFKAGEDVASFDVDLQDDNLFRIAFAKNACPTDNACCMKPTTDAPASTVSPTQPPTTEITTEVSNKISVPYPPGKAITGAYADHAGINRDYGTRFDIGQKWVIPLGVLAGLGIVCVIVFEISILYRLISTRMGHKWRTMWLGQLLMFGIFLSYAVLFAYIPIPTDATCGITRFGVGLAYAICFAVLLVKLMVILTSKTSDMLLPGDMESPNYLKGVYQFLMFSFAVGVQIVINIQWLITVPPEAVLVKTTSGAKKWMCNHYTWETGKDMGFMPDFIRTNFENHLMSLVYIMIIIFIITILSLNAHGIITNHRESVFIGISSGFSIPIWLAWGLLGGLSTDKDNADEYGDASIAFGLLLTATIILFAMFLPKVRQLVNMGVEGIYLEDDRDTYYAGSVIMAPPSYRSKGPSSVIYVNNQGIMSEPMVIGNGDPRKDATHLKHPGSTYSAPPNYLKKSESTYGGSRVLRMTDDLKGRHPQKKSQSEADFGASMKSRSNKGTLPRSRSQTDLGAL